MTSQSRSTAYFAASFIACVAVACSTSTNDTPGGTGGSGGQGGSGGAGTVTGCSTQAIKLLFNPMYSAFDGVHRFQIPVITPGVTGSAVTWSSSDPTMVAIAPETITGYDGIMITTLKAGTVSIIASIGGATGACGSSLLTITAATPDDWEVGNARYNTGEVVSITGGRGGMGGIIRVADGGDAKCTNCHGETAMGPYKTVSHSPVQTGGFSDTDLVNVFQHGEVPEGGVFNTDIVAYNTWHQFHQWGLSDDEAKGMIVYLRSLTPVLQVGAANFGQRNFEAGAFNFEGGMMGGGREGGGRGGMNMDAMAPPQNLDAGLPQPDVSAAPAADATTAPTADAAAE